MADQRERMFNNVLRQSSLHWSSSFAKQALRYLTRYSFSTTSSSTLGISAHLHNKFSSKVSIVRLTSMSCRHIASNEPR